MYSETYTDAMHKAHYPAMALSLLVAVLGILLAFYVYQWQKIEADSIAAKFNKLYEFSYNKWYFDEFYNSTFVAFTLGISKVSAWFDRRIINGIVDGSAYVTRHLAFFIGTFDRVVVDGLVNFTAYFSGFIGLLFRRFQTGKIQTYIVLVIFSIVILLLVFKNF